MVSAVRAPKSLNVLWVSDCTDRTYLSSHVYKGNSADRWLQRCAYMAAMVSKVSTSVMCQDLNGLQPSKVSASSVRFGGEVRAPQPCAGLAGACDLAPPSTVQLMVYQMIPLRYQALS